MIQYRNIGGEMLLNLPLLCLIVGGATTVTEITLDVKSSTAERITRTEKLPVFFWFKWPDEAPRTNPIQEFGNGLYKMKVPGTLTHVFHSDEFEGHSIIFNQTDNCWHYDKYFTVGHG